VGEPATVCHVFGPQHAAWMPLSPSRIAGSPFVMMFGDPEIAGPVVGCGHAGQPCASSGHCARSPNLAPPGISKRPPYFWAV